MSRKPKTVPVEVLSASTVQSPSSEAGPVYVEATGPGYYVKLRQVGDRFWLLPPHTVGRWMRVVDPADSPPPPLSADDAA